MEIKSLEMLPSEILIALANQVLKIIYSRANLDTTSEAITIEVGSKALDFIAAEVKARSDRANLLFCTLLRLTGATLQQNSEEEEIEVEVLKN